ncbi:alpha/beta hydrolase [Lactiplantibacillus plantarum]|uniref:alpha/beta hydrolase n=1 Tax=Lactiplantibacillus plantarum TaxID=1590 RepID=UPI003C1456C5
MFSVITKYHKGRHSLFLYNSEIFYAFTQDILRSRKYIPNSIDMYSLAGTQSYSNDGLVPLYSVLAGRYIYQKQVKHYTQITVSGVGAEHSDLPQNQQIIMAIEQYIEK